LMLMSGFLLHSLWIVSFCLASYLSSGLGICRVRYKNLYSGGFEYFL
jgi:hypothetical protein